MIPVSIFTAAKDALVGVAMEPVIRERLSLALDQSAVLEKKADEAQNTIGEMRAELKMARREEQQAKRELETLRKEHEEDVVIERTVEFRRGKRTMGKWVPFCPNCHLPLALPADHGNHLHCSDTGKCQWWSSLMHSELSGTLARLPE